MLVSGRAFKKGVSVRRFFHAIAVIRASSSAGSAGENSAQSARRCGAGRPRSAA
jgi:hypothetical protein